MELNVVEFPVKTEYTTNGWEGMIHGPNKNWMNFGRNLHYYFVFPGHPASVATPPEIVAATEAALAAPEMDPELIREATTLWHEACLNVPLLGMCISSVEAKYVHDTMLLRMGSQLWTPEDAWMDK